jgi:hypothetical protein
MRLQTSAFRPGARGLIDPTEKLAAPKTKPRALVNALDRQQNVVDA